MREHAIIAIDKDLLPYTMEENASNMNSEVDLLRFYERSPNGIPLDLDPRDEVRRIRVWDLKCGTRKFDIKAASVDLEVPIKVISKDLRICQKRFEEWINTYGLSVYGSPASRLHRHVGNLITDVESLEDDLKLAETVKERQSIRSTLMIARKELAKFQAIVPPTVVINLTENPADVARSKLNELFPDDDANKPQISPLNDQTIDASFTAAEDSSPGSIIETLGSEKPGFEKRDPPEPIKSPEDE